MAAQEAGLVLIGSSALLTASYAVATGLALVFILRAPAAAAPAPPPVLEAAGGLQGQG